VPADDINIALDREWNAVERAKYIAALDGSFCGKRLQARGVGIHVCEGVEPAFAFGDALEGGVHDFDGGYFLRADALGEACDGGIVKNGTHDGSCEAKLRLGAGQPSNVGKRANSIDANWLGREN